MADPVEKPECERLSKPEYTSIHTDISSGMKSLDDEDESMEWKQTEREVTESVVVQVDSFPGPKERRKTLSRVMTRMYMFLHDLDWAGFDKYTTELVSRYPRDPDVKTLLAIYKSDRLRNSGDLAGAVSMFTEIETLLSGADSLDCLCVRYLTTKAFTMHFLGHQDQSLSLQGQAVQMGVIQAASNPTAYNLVTYALHCCLHRVGERGASQIPTEADWRRAETYYSMGCEQHLIWTRDLEEDTKIPESVSASFFLFSFVRYIFALVRSCVAGGFVYFDKHHCPPDNLPKAIKCIEQVKQQEQFLSTRTKFEFALVQCDYFLRKSKQSSTRDQMNLICKAEQFAHKALSITRKLMDPKHATFHRTFVNSRLKYIHIRQKNNNSEPVFREVLSDVSQSSRLSHMDSFKTPGSEDLVSLSATRDFLRDLGHSKSHFGTGSENHVAGCPECALAHTVPKEAGILELNLDEQDGRFEVLDIDLHAVNYDPILTELGAYGNTEGVFVGNLGETSDFVTEMLPPDSLTGLQSMSNNPLPLDITGPEASEIFRHELDSEQSVASAKVGKASPFVVSRRNQDEDQTNV